MQLIAIIEDELALAELERDYLVQANFDCVILQRGDDAKMWLENHRPDLIVLDIMLPGVDGITLCKHIRATSAVPIILTTAKVEEIDRLLGLELGADDYLCKPFSLRELVARVKVILRRVTALAEPLDGSMPVQLVVEPDAVLVRFANKQIELTLVEMNLLTALMARSGQILSRDQLIDKIYNDRRIVSDRTIDSHIKKLRRKLQDIDPEHDYIHSVYGAGYRFDARFSGSKPSL